MHVGSNFIAGQWVPAVRTMPNVNPARPGEVIGEYAMGTVEDIRNAIAAARAAQPIFAAMPLDERALVLRRVAQELFQRAEELGCLLSREEGKTRAEGIGEVRRAAMAVDYFAGEVHRVNGGHLRGLRDGFEVIITRDPVGVVAAITPWNFPIAVPAWKCAAALAYGNTVVLKPSEYTPGCAWELVDIYARAGLPAGAINLVGGDGRELGPELVSGVDAISFTGAEPTGRAINAVAAPLLKKVQLELGGKNPLIIDKDADIDMAVQCALDGSFFATGQRCTASSRLIVHAAIYDEFVARLTKAVNEVVVGDPLVQGTRIGPIATEPQYRKVLDYVRIAKEEGAQVIAGGEAMETEDGGYFIRPTLFAEVRNDMRIAREEVFGPVAAIIKVQNLDEAIKIANDTEFGLSSGIITGSLAAAGEFRRRSKAGMVMINAPTAGVDYHVPFKGHGSSGFGVGETGVVSIEFFTEVRTHYINSGKI